MKRQIIFLTVVLALLYLAGCITANSAKIGDLSDDSAETGQNLPTEETMDQELPDEKLPENVPDSPGTQEETPVLAENAQEINNISPKQVQKWAFIGKISKEHSTLLNVLMLHTKTRENLMPSLIKIPANTVKNISGFYLMGQAYISQKTTNYLLIKKADPPPKK